MRDNQSDGDSGRPRPPEYSGPWAWPGEEEAAPMPWPGPGASSPPEDGGWDTIAFGKPPAPPGYRHAGYGQAGYCEPGDGQAGYGEPGDGQAGYRQAWPGERQAWPGEQRSYPEQPGRGEAGERRDDGGYPPAGWGSPDPPEPSRHRGRFLVYLAVAALAASIGAGVTVAVDHHGSGASSGGISSSDVPGPGSNAAGSGSKSARLNRAMVEKKVEPGLVDITSTLKYSSETAVGTGMIISSSGLVLTNNHVIDQATNVQAKLVHPGSESAMSYPARIVGYDQADDVALLQLQGAAGLPTVSFGNSAQVSVGTPVLALGNAEGRGIATPAAGIINALNRSIHASDQGSASTENLNHMLQTNAQIQQGDSGGALANSAGQVIGMITAANTASSSRAAPPGGTLGFAIPINNALAVARQIASGRASSSVSIGLPGFLGVEVAQSISPDPHQQASDEASSGRAGSGGSAGCQVTNQQPGIPARIAPVSSGALILAILCDTAASDQGLVPGDVITSVEGQPVTTPDSLTNITAMYHPGEIVSVSWVAINGARHTASLVLGNGPAR